MRMIATLVIAVCAAMATSSLMAQCQSTGRQTTGRRAGPNLTAPLGMNQMFAPSVQPATLLAAQQQPFAERYYRQRLLLAHQQAQAETAARESAQAERLNHRRARAQAIRDARAARRAAAQQQASADDNAS